MTDEPPLTRKQRKQLAKIKAIVDAPNVIITTKEESPYTQRFKQTRTPRKPDKKRTRSGEHGREPKLKCPVCELYMYKQSSRVYGDKAGWIPTSWLCRKCGHMELYSEGFEAVKIE